MVPKGGGVGGASVYLLFAERGRDNHQFLLATPVENEVTKIAICSVLPIFDRRAIFYGNFHFQVKYSIEYLTAKEICIYIYIYISTTLA